MTGSLTQWTKELAWVVIWAANGKIKSIWGPYTMIEANKFARRNPDYHAFYVINLEGMEVFSGEDTDSKSQ